MSFKLFSISSIYSGYLESFYLKHSDIHILSYNEHINYLLADTTEFVGSYIRNFRKLGIDADCVIVNDNYLQKKWGQENGIKSDKNIDIIFEQVNSYRPDILWIENLSYINHDWLNSVRDQIKSVRLIVAYHCAPFNAKVLESMDGVDFIITCTPGLKSIIENMGRKSYLVYHGFDKDILSRITNEALKYQNDFIFSGSLISGSEFHKNRIKLIERILKEDIDIGLYVNLEKKYKIRTKQSIYLFATFLKKLNMGNWMENFKILEYGKSWVDTYSETLMKVKSSPVYGIDMYNLFLHSKIVLNFHIGVAGDYAGNMRIFEVTGVGSCLLTDNKKNMSELFDTNCEVVVYDNEEDCISKVKWLLEHEDERKKIALCGQKRTHNSHTIENRCESIIEIINNELKKPRNVFGKI